MAARENRLRAGKTIAVVRALALRQAECHAIGSHRAVEDAGRGVEAARIGLQTAEGAWQNAINAKGWFDPAIASLFGSDVMRGVDGVVDAQDALDDRHVQAGDADALWSTALAQDRLAAEHVVAEQRRARLRMEARQTLDLDDLWRMRTAL